MFSMKLRIFRESYDELFIFLRKKYQENYQDLMTIRNCKKKKKNLKIQFFKFRVISLVNLMKWFFVDYRLVTWRRGWERCEGRQWGQTLRQQSKQKTFFSLLRRLSWIPQLEKKVSPINPLSHAGLVVAATIIIISSSSSSSSSWPSLTIFVRQDPDEKLLNF